MTTKYKGIEIELGGTVYVVPPIALGDLEQLQDRIEKFDGTTSKESVDTVVDAAYAALKRNYPEITKDQLRIDLDVANFVDVFTAVVDMAGLRRKEIEEGKRQAAMTEQNRTGADSTPI